MDEDLMNLALPSMAKSPAKKSQQISATYLNIVGPVVPSHGQMIATFRCNISQHCWAQRVACVWPPCCEVLWHVASGIELVRMPWRNIVARTWPNDFNIIQHPQMLRENIDHCFFSNLSQQHPTVATRRNMVAKRAQHVAPRMLRYVALKCCHRLAEDSQKKDYTVNIFGMHI